MVGDCFRKKRLALWTDVFQIVRLQTTIVYEAFVGVSDSGGIQTHDLQNRNLTLYSAKLPSHFRKAAERLTGAKVRFFLLSAYAFEIE